MSTAQASEDQLVNVPPEIAGLLSAVTARRLRAVPLGFTEEHPPALQVAMRDPEDPAVVAQLRAIAGHPIAPLGASSLQLGLALDRHYTEMSWSLVPTPPPAPAPAATPADKGGWKRLALPDGHEDDGMLHAGSAWLGKTLVLGLVLGILLCGAMYLRVLLRERSREEHREPRWEQRDVRRPTGQLDAAEPGDLDG